VIGRAFDLRVLAVCIVSFMSTSSANAATHVQRVVSPGGIVAWLVEEHSVPLISVEFAFRGGSAQDAATRQGTGNLLSGLLDEGAGDLDSQAFQRRLEENAVEMGFHVSRDTFDGSLKMLAEKREEGFELLRLALNEARLDAEPIERIRAQILARIRRQSTDPQHLAYRAWYAAAFPDHAYGREPEGNETSVAAITRDDLVQYRKDVFARSGLLVAVVGAIDAKTLGPELDRVFGALPAEGHLNPVAEVKPQNVGKTEVVPLPGPQTAIVFGRGGILREDPDYIPAVVMNHILGGGSFTSRLFAEVREKRGLAYSVYSYLDPMEHAGIFAGGLATRNDRAFDAVTLIEDMIGLFATQGPTEDELAKAKKYLTGSYALNFDSSVKIARGLRQIQVNGLPIDYIEKRNDMVNAVTVEDIQRVAKRILGDGTLLVVAVGTPAGMRDAKVTVLPAPAAATASETEPAPGATPN